MSNQHALVVSLSVLSLLTPPAGAQTPEPERGARRADLAQLETERAAGVESSAAAVLRRHVDRVDWEEAPFLDVLDWLREQGELNVVVVWRALPVDEDATVDLLLHDTSVAEVLSEVLMQLGEDEEIIFRARGNTIRISTRVDFERKLTVRVYDVTDLLQRTPDYAGSAPRIDLQQAVQSSQPGRGGSRSVLTSGEGNATEQGRALQQEQQWRAQELIDTIRRTVRPSFWFETEQGPGSIRALDTALVVRASAEVHEEIAGFFVEGQ